MRITQLRSCLMALLWLFALTAAQGQSTPSTQYTLSLARAEDHLIRVQMELAPGPAERELQLPVWNALYQVRDFSQYVNWITATGEDNATLPIRKIEKGRWRITGAAHGVRVEYEIYADAAGPYSAQVNDHHAFLNMADVLLYALDSRDAPLAVQFVDVPAGWKTATALSSCMPSRYCAQNYDRLVDSPFELGRFREQDFEEDGARYRVVVDADSGDYDMGDIVQKLKRVVHAAVRWMDDRPFESYVFFYHFPRGPAGGGMEHAYGTAIDINAAGLKDNPEWFADVSAHEFFHLWNVKRIRPRSLEPVDYTKENYTRALWFCEGVTSTVQGYILLQAGLLDERRYLVRLGEQITTLQTRPARHTQSAEESSLDAWLEKYVYYRRPDRSISYYNKGELLGVLLDLKMREGSRGTASLRELFRWMNERYARQGEFYQDSEGVREAAETVCQCDLHDFFERYVAGTKEIPWDEMFASVGLRVVSQTVEVGDPGFDVQRMFGGRIVVTQVYPGSDAARAGLKNGDLLLEVDGSLIVGDPGEWLRSLRPGRVLRVKVQRGNDQPVFTFKLGAQKEVEYAVKDVESLTAEQKTRRREWLRGEVRGAARP